MTKHTPGPWYYDDLLHEVVDNHDRTICECNEPLPERDANVRLIAAAPALLSAAKDMLVALGAARVGDYAAANWMNAAERSIEQAIAIAEAP